MKRSIGYSGRPENPLAPKWEATEAPTFSTWMKWSPLTRKIFEEEFPRGKTIFQRFLLSEWLKIADMDRGGGASEDWRAVETHAKRLLAAGMRVRLDSVMNASDEFLKQLDELRKDSWYEAQPKYRMSRLLNRERVFWVSALLPYLIHTTGKKSWDWLAYFLSDREGKRVDSATLQGWWHNVLKGMEKDWPPRKLKRLPDRIPGGPPMKYPPFDASELYLDWAKASLTKRQRRTYLEIVFREIKFLTGLAPD